VVGQEVQYRGRFTPRDPLIRIGVAWTVVVALGLIVWLIATGVKVAGAVILLGPLIGAALAFSWPRSYAALVTASLLIGAAAILLLIGLTGFLFIPPFLLLLAALFREGKRRRGLLKASERT
jgi:hypothetical protein